MGALAMWPAANRQAIAMTRQLSGGAEDMYLARLFRIEFRCVNNARVLIVTRTSRNHVRLVRAVPPKTWWLSLVDFA